MALNIQAVGRKSNAFKRIAFCAIAVASICAGACTELQIPATTAYLEPEHAGARISRRGITGWPASKQTISWFGKFNKAGDVDVSLSLKLAPPGESLRLRLALDDQSKEALIKSTNAEANVIASFGRFKIGTVGYHRFQLECLDTPKSVEAQIQTLNLSGPIAEKAHFNLQPRRNAASVHLMYPTRADAKVNAFYCEVRAAKDPAGTFYMACGFHRGYLGMQVNSPTERRIIFSVWDSGKEAVDRRKVAPEDKVQLIAKGEGVIADDFGNEGTGGHSHKIFAWKTGEPQRFVITATPADGAHTIFAGYFFDPDSKQWMLLSAWKAPKDGGWLRHLHSFSEDFLAENGQQQRKAFYGNQWMRTMDGQWHELTTASFSHDETGRADRLDRFMGVEDGRFFLSHGGFVDGFTRYGEQFTRPNSGQAPRLSLPELPKTETTSANP